MSGITSLLDADSLGQVAAAPVPAPQQQQQQQQQASAIKPESTSQFQLGAYWREHKNKITALVVVAIAVIFIIVIAVSTRSGEHHEGAPRKIEKKKPPLLVKDENEHLVGYADPTDRTDPHHIGSFADKSGDLSACTECPSVIAFLPEDNVRDRIIEGLDKATHSVDVAMFSLGDKQLVDKLIKIASETSVMVRLIINMKNAAGIRSCIKVKGGKCYRLTKAGVDVRYVRTGIMHHKFGLVNMNYAEAAMGKTPEEEEQRLANALVMTGSCNWSSSSMRGRYDENWMRYDYSNSPQIVTSYHKEFEYLWQYSRPTQPVENDISAKSLPRATHTDPKFLQPIMLKATTGADDVMAPPPPANKYTAFTSQNFEPFVSGGLWSWRKPKTDDKVTDAEVVIDDQVSDSRRITVTNVVPGVVSQRIIDKINGATKIVRVIHTYLRYAAIGEALIQAHDRGVAVVLHNDGKEVDDDLETISENMHEEGIPTTYKYYMRHWDHSQAKIMHTKYLIVDDEWLITGSYNLSENSEKNSFENTVVVTHPAAIYPFLERLPKAMWFDRTEYEQVLKEPSCLWDKAFALSLEEVNAYKAKQDEHKKCRRRKLLLLR